MWFDDANQYLPDLQWKNLTKMEVNDKKIINKLRLTALPQFPSIAALCRMNYITFIYLFFLLLKNFLDLRSKWSTMISFKLFV